jgi:hypothetical protein
LLGLGKLALGEVMAIMRLRNGRRAPRKGGPGRWSVTSVKPQPKVVDERTRRGKVSARHERLGCLGCHRGGDRPIPRTSDHVEPYRGRLAGRLRVLVVHVKTRQLSGHADELAGQSGLPRSLQCRAKASVSFGTLAASEKD